MPRARWGERGAYAREEGFGRRYTPYGSSRDDSGRGSRGFSGHDSSSDEGGDPEPIMADIDAIAAKHNMSEGQRRVLEKALEGVSVFFTGSAGAGKSYCLKAVIAELRRHKRKVAVTASTGAAAVLIGGVTLHSWAGIGIAEGTFDTIVNKVLSSKRARKHWRRTHVLVIDEISMLDPKIFDLLDRIGRRVRGSSLPFGGLQLIVCGDFAQLPPVQRVKNADDVVFAFQASSWKRSIQESILLTQVFRQKDEAFLRVLNEVRFNQMTDKSIELLEQSQHNNLSNEKGILPTKLYARNRDVDKLNLRMLDKIQGEECLFKAFDWAIDGVQLANIKRNSSYPEKLALKEGAQVILLKNLDFDKSLVNGSRGVVTSIRDDGILIQFMEVEHLIEKDKHEVSDGFRTIAYRYQYPLNLAWAMTIHKAQGSTCDLLEVDLEGCFEAGQAYTALSRSSDYSGMKVLNFTPEVIDAHPLVVEFHRDLYKRNNLDFDKLFPATKRKTRAGTSSNTDGAQRITEAQKQAICGESIDGSAFCVTGEMADPSLTREQIKKMIVSKGGVLKSTVSKNTDFLLAGVRLDSQWAKGRSVESSSKYKKAKKLGIPIISEAQLLHMYNNGSSKANDHVQDMPKSVNHSENNSNTINSHRDYRLPESKPFVEPPSSEPLDLFEDPFA